MSNLKLQEELPEKEEPVRISKEKVNGRVKVSCMIPLEKLYVTRRRFTLTAGRSGHASAPTVAR